MDYGLSGNSFEIVPNCGRNHYAKFEIDRNYSNMSKLMKKANRSGRRDGRLDGSALKIEKPRF